MWYILKAEFSYNQRHLLIMLSLIPLVCAIEILVPDVPGYLILAVLFLAILNWNILRNKESRDVQQARLPLPIRHVAAARILMVAGIGLGLIAVYKLIYLIVAPGPWRYHGNPLVFLGLMIIGFSGYFILRDLLLSLFRSWGLTKERSRLTLMLAAVALNVLGIIFLFKLTSVKVSPIPLEPILLFLAGQSPVHQGLGLLKFMAACVGLGVLTLFTFGQRQSYLG